jgi:predicted benzoate:H+ symporter BenE
MDKSSDKPLHKRTTYWIGFAAALLVALVIGGFITNLFGGCPAYFWLLLASILFAGVTGYAFDQALRGRLSDHASKAQQRVRSSVRQVRRELRRSSATR